MFQHLLNLKMYKKLLLSPLVGICFLLVLGSVSYMGLNDQKSVIRDIFENRFQMFQDSAGIMGNVKSVHANIYHVLNLSSIDADAKVIDELGKKQLATLKETVNLVKKALGRDLTPQEKKHFDSSLQQLTAYSDTVYKVVDMAAADYNLATTLMKPAVEKFQVLNQNLQELMELESRLSQEKYRFSMESFDTTLRIFVAVLATAILLSLLTSLFMTRFLLSMIRKTSGVVELIANGDLSHGLDIRAKDELGLLAQSIDTMRDKMEQAVGKSMIISQSLAESAQEQAAALEETSASLEETASMTKQNATNTMEANELMNSSSKATGQANASMGDLTKSMKDIADASGQAQKVVKSIDEIAFQTNLLALNAAVEAARAGEAGAGFAVVAGEVRNLAMRATTAAKETSSLIDDIIRKVGVGENLVTTTNKAFQEVNDTSKRVVELVGHIAAASQEQTGGITEISRAMNEMNVVTQRNAELSEELALTMSIFKTKQGRGEALAGGPPRLAAGNAAPSDNGGMIRAKALSEHAQQSLRKERPSLDK